MKNKTAIILILCFFSIKLTNGQNQWVSQVSGTSSFLKSVFFVSADTGYVAVEAGSILKTVNGGTNWVHVGNGPEKCLFFLTSKKGFGTYDNYIISTVNGGVNWNSCYTNPNISDIVSLNFPDKKHGYAAAWGQDIDNYVIKTNNGGTSWDTIYKYSGNFANFESIFFTDSMTGYVATENGNILKTTNCGSSWTITPIDLVNTVAIASIYFPTADTGYAATDIQVYKTTDGGSTWNGLPQYFSPSLYSIFFTDTKHGCVGGGNGYNSMTLYQTNNGGNTWHQGASGVQTLNSVFFADSLPGYAVGTNGTILKYTNVTGIEDNAQTETFSIYPNPANDLLTIQLSEPNAKAEIKIYDQLGQIESFLNVSTPQTKIDISNLTNGVYVIELKTENTNSRQKFVKE